MKKLLQILSIIIVFASCSVEPVQTDECGKMVLSTPNMANYDYKTGFIEGDILPDKGYFEKGFIVSDKDRIWKDGIIPYYYRPEERNDGIVIMGFDPAEQKIIDAALLEFSQKTVIQFIKFNSREHLLENFPDGLEIVPGFGRSFAHLGRQGGIQPLGIAMFFADDPPENIDEVIANLFHEAGHTANMIHEFNRPDRDEYLTVHWDNIPEYLQRQFNKADGVAFGKLDMQSIMMYGSTNAAKKGTYSITTTGGEAFERNYELSKCDCVALESQYAD